MKKTVLLFVVIALVVAGYWYRHRIDPQTTAKKALDARPILEDGFRVLPLQCDAKECSFTLHLVPHRGREPGVLDWVRSDLASDPGKPQEILLTLESIDDADGRTVQFLKQIPVAELGREQKIRVTIPAAQANKDFGMFLCRDWKGANHCREKVPFDSFVLTGAGSRVRQKDPSRNVDSFYVFSYLYLSREQGRALAYGGFPRQPNLVAMEKRIASLKRLAPPARPEGFVWASGIARSLDYPGLQNVDGNYMLLLTECWMQPTPARR